jgi:hypothetical protein
MKNLRSCRVIPVVAALLLLSSGLLAQEKFPVKLGLKLSPNLGWLHPNTQDYSTGKASFGGTVGLISEFYFTERYAFTTGLNFEFLNGNMKFPYNATKDTTLVSGQMNQKVGITYIDIPLMLKMSTREFGNFSFYGQAGFSVGFNISSKVKEEFSSDQGFSYSDKKDFSSYTTLVRGSVNIGIGTEYHLDKATRILLGFAYSNSLNNVLKDKNNISNLDVKAWMNYLELNIGILF